MQDDDTLLQKIGLVIITMFQVSIGLLIFGLPLWVMLSYFGAFG